MTPARWFRTIWVCAGLALVLGLGRETILGLLPRPRELPRLDGATGMPWVSDGFGIPTAAEIETGLLPPHIQTASSGSHGDAWQGRAESAWFRITRRWWVHVAVAGYPQHAGCSLWAEFRFEDGHVLRLDCPLPDPRERWNGWEIRKPAGAIAVRIVAEDRASDTFGWVAFSHPFRAWPGAITAGYHALQIATTLALAMTLLWCPGLVWRPKNTSPETRTAFLLGLGPLLLAALGILTWCLSGAVPAQVPATIGVVALWLAIGAAARKRHFGFALSAATHRVLGVTALVLVAVAAKSSYSRGPEGELFRASISRNLTVGDRIDSRYPFYVVQVAAQHLAPASPAAEKFFYPWTFFSRGPLAGLVTTPVVLATGGKPPADMPDQRWSPYDHYGFAGYRLTMSALAGGIVLALFFVLTPLVGERWALIGAGLLALSPFGVHEVMFTWPKWAATTWVVISFSFAHVRRPAAAGLALGFGFFFHPLTLLWAPWLVLWAAGRSAGSPGSAGVPARTEADPASTMGETPMPHPSRALPSSRANVARWFGRFAASALRFGGAVALPVLPWMALGAWMPHLPDTPFAGQSGFAGYFLSADRMAATWQTWWQTRWMNFANTFIPVHVYFSGFDHFRFQSAYGASGRLVKFAFVWWNSLPFGLGLGLWLLSLAALALAFRRLRAATWLFVIGPALLLTAYWGWDPLGLMRECGHPLFVAIIAIVVVIAARTEGRLAAILRHRAVPWLQLPETWLMLWLTTFASRDSLPVELAQLDPVYVLMNALALAGAAWVLSRARANADFDRAADAMMASDRTT